MIDILMITHNRPSYTRLSLERLVETCHDRARVWLWHNGEDAETLAISQEFAEHPAVHRFHHSVQNQKLREPTNWLWRESDGDYLSKIDDDCLVPHGWLETLEKAHEDNPKFGVIGCWRFAQEDFNPEVAAKKIHAYPGGHQLLRNCWIEGSGYLMKRACVERQGLIQDSESFTRYCVRLASKGCLNGWYFPFLPQEHMDDPRTQHCLLNEPGMFDRYAPLSAKTFGVSGVDAWLAALQRDARRVQAADLRPWTFGRAGRLLKKLRLMKR